MDELSAAIEAAAAAAAASSLSPPKSPEVKIEPKHEASLPEIASSSPLKRARLPLDDAGPTDEKRQKFNGEEVLPTESLAPQPEPRAEAESRTEPEPVAAAQTTSNPEPEPKPAPPRETEAEVIPQPEPEPKAEILPDTEAAVDEVVPQTQLEQEPASQQEQESNPMVDISEGLADLDEITKMIQAAQEAALGTDGVPEDHPMPDFHAEVNGLTGDHGHDIDINSIMASIASSLENGGNGDIHGDSSHDIHAGALPLPDMTTTAQVTPKRASIWSHRAQYTRQTYILPTLGKVAVDILIALCDQELEETITCLNDPDNGHSVGKEYAVLRSFFDALRKQLSEDFPLLYPEQLDISSAEDREIIRIANLATSCASMFGANELGWPDLNASFLSTFVADGQQMPSDEAELYLALKTQMFLTLLESEQTKPRAQILEELFVSGQEDSLRKHHPGVPLALSETKFLADAEARKTMLLNESHDSASIQALSTQYTYESFLEELSGYLSRHMTNIEKLGSSPTSVSTDADSSGLFDGISGLDNFDIDAAIAEAAKAAQEASEDNGTTNISDDIAALISFASEQAQGQSLPSEMPSTVLSTSESAMRATNLALQTMQRNQYHPTTVQQANNSSSNGHHSSHQSQQPSQQPTQQQQYYAYPQQPNTPAQQAQTSDRPELPPGQHASSEILYERARQAAAARSSTHARREGSHSTRRPWSPEEEKALMMGLDMVKGPHWSQILSLFGQQGRMSNILADRTQVQLKDKARNLKLFFLKTNSEMPYYLQCVTGELKTRAPTQAARKEAEERARLTSEDEKAHISATMALGNMHNGNGQRPQPKPSPSKSGIPGQIAAHSQSHPGSPHATHLQRTASGHGSVPASTQSSLPSGQHVQLAQAAQKPQVALQPQQHVQQMQQVAPRPAPQPQSHVPLKPHQQHTPLQQQPTLQPQVSHQQSMQNQQRQAAPQHHQPHLQPHHQQKSVHQQSQLQSQLQSPMQQQHTPAQAQAQPQPQQTSQASPQTSTNHTPVPPKSEESTVKHEPLNEEEAGLMELKRFMSQENSVDQDQSLEAALAAASAAAAAAVAAQPTT